MGFTLLGILSASSAAAGRVGVAGYFVGGSNDNKQSVIDKISFANDSRSTLGTGLNEAKSGMAGVANSGVAGYALGGQATGVDRNVIEKFVFPTDSKSTLAATSFSGYQHGISNSGVAGYVWTEQSDSKFRKLSFSSETISTGTSIGVSYSAGPGLSNFGVAGYFLNAAFLKVNFATEAVTKFGSALSFTGTRGRGGMSNQGTAGYVFDKTIYKLNFSNDSYATITPSLTLSDSNGAGNSGVAGYIGGGNDGPYRNYIYKYIFSSDTYSLSAATLSLARENVTTFSDEGIF